jgi:hypothetical protein
MKAVDLTTFQLALKDPNQWALFKILKSSLSKEI